jgi:hypothetical protein
MARLTALAFATLAMVALCAGSSKAQTGINIVNTVPGTYNSDLGGYLWQYQVQGGSSPALSHWVLGICQNVFNDIMPGSIGYTSGLNPITGFLPTPSGQIEFGTDPTTGLFGLKFDYGYDDGELRYVRFVLDEDHEATTLTAKSKSGGNINTFSVVGPSCSTRTPEPATLAMLSLAAPGAFVFLRRRRVG